MASDSNSGSSFAEPTFTDDRPNIQARARHRLVSRIFGGKPLCESVATHVHMAFHPEALWRCIQFYEEVPGRPPLLLRALIPAPVRSHGDKTAAGSKVLCLYDSGMLVKRITTLEKPHLIEFELLEQSLGIERCVVAEGGSYKIHWNGHDSTVVLTTNYLAYLRPRWLWAPLERLVVHQLHKHILGGMRKTLAAANAPSHNPIAGLQRTETLES